MTTNRTYITIGIVGVIAALILLWSLFRPELLFVNATVNEAVPIANDAAPPQAMSSEMEQPTTTVMSNEQTEKQPAAMVETAPTIITSAPSATWSGSFQSLAHETKGSADIRVLEDNSRVLRLENFTTSNGPDVRVYLVRGNDGTQDEAIKRGDFIDLGALKGNIGDQNYTIPAEVDLSEYQSVSIWCRRFSVNFGATMLN